MWRVGTSTSLALVAPGQFERLPNSVRSMLRNVVSFSRDRDVRTSNWILLRALETLVLAQSVAIDVSNDGKTVMDHLFLGAKHDADLLFVVAFRGHVRWDKPTEYCNPAEWGNWAEGVGQVPLRSN